GRRRRSGERPPLAPMSELIFRPLGIGKVAVEVARLRADRLQNIARLVTSLALVDVGDDVAIGPRTAVGVDPAHGHRVARYVEGGLGLRLVPDVGKPDPALGLVLE